MSARAMVLRDEAFGGNQIKKSTKLKKFLAKGKKFDIFRVDINRALYELEGGY